MKPAHMTLKAIKMGVWVFYDKASPTIICYFLTDFRSLPGPQTSFVCILICLHKQQKAFPGVCISQVEEKQKPGVFPV